MAIDASSKQTGIAIFEDDKLIDKILITSNDKDSLNRIEEMTNKIGQIIYHKYSINRVVMEDILPTDVGKNQTIFNVLHYLQAQIVLLMHRLQIPVELCTASHWRQMCGIRTGRGIKRDELKAADIAFVKEKYNIDVNDDVADAICIGWAYTHK